MSKYQSGDILVSIPEYDYMYVESVSKRYYILLDLEFNYSPCVFETEFTEDELWFIFVTDIFRGNDDY